MASPSHRRKLVQNTLRLGLLALAVVVAGATAGLAPPGVAAAGSGPVAAYSFDAGSGSTVADATGNGNTGTIANATWSASGHTGSALSFNGSNAWVTVPDSASLDLTTAYTLEAWVKPTGPNGVWRAAVIKEDPTRSELDYGLYANTDSGPPSAHVLVGNPPDTYLRGTATPPLNSWTHIAATYDGTTLRIYANGVQQASKAVSGAITTANGALRIGGDAVWGEYFAGLIDDVRVYNRALSTSELQTDMSTPVGTVTPPPPPPPPPASGLVAAYAFDTGSGSTVADATGNGNTGTIANATWSASGHTGSALSFNGSNAWVTVPDTASLDFTTGYTLEAWVKPTAANGQWRAAVIKEDPAQSELDYGLYAATDTGPPSAHVLVGNPPDTYIRGTATPPLNSWTHVAATYDGATLRVYANGVQQGSKTVKGAIDTSTGALRIGGDAVWGEYFAGLIDDVRVYNRALSTSELQTDMSTPVGGAVTPPPPPPPGDTTAPTAPTGLAASGGTQSSMQLAWNASTDNVGVTGYEVSVNGTIVGTPAATAYAVSGLGCGTSYTFAVDAYDAAGNRSAKASTTGTTTACSGSGANEYVSSSGSDAGTCTASAPCKSFDRAYHVALPGDTIQVAGGTYPDQTITLDTTKVSATADVVLLPAAGATVTISGDLNVYGSHLDIRGSTAGNFKLHNLEVLGTQGSNTAQHDTFENLDGAGFEIGPTSYITIKGGDWGPNYVCGGGGTVENKVGPDGVITNQWPTNIVLDGLKIHNQNSEDLNSCHMGGLFLISGGPITLRNSTFSQTVVYDIQIQNFTTTSCCGMNYGPVHDVTIENNWFGTPVTGLKDPTGGNAGDNQPDVQFDPRNGECWKNILVRFNSFTNGPDLGFDNPPCFQNMRVVGNIGGANACFSGVTYGYNAWVGGTCAASDVSLGSLPYKSTTVGAENYDITGGAAMNLVSPTTGDYALATDIHGNPRPGPASPNRDAGADEAG